MHRTMHRVWLPAAVAFLLSGGSLVAAQDQPADQDIGAEYSAPEWQVYDQLDERYGPLAWLTFGEVIGSQVVDTDGQPMGEIIHLLRAKDGGMFYALLDTTEAADAGDQIVPVDHLEVVGDSEAERQIVLTGAGTGDFDASDFETAPPPAGGEQQG